jgi:hypothetical protein
MSLGEKIDTLLIYINTDDTHFENPAIRMAINQHLEHSRQ